jgi:adenylate cyclase
MSSASNEKPPANHAYLKRLLSERNQYPERAPAIDALVRQTFERMVSMLVLDMCGFSRLSLKHGIIHFLAMVEQMHEGAFPAVRGNGGQVVKTEADNIFAIFPEPAHALEASLDIFRSFEAINAVVPPERHLRGSIGIGFGDTLVISGEDLFGCEMNLASKLGEDLAAGMEILLTEAAYHALPSGRYEMEPVSFSVSGMELPSYRFQRCLHPSLVVE